MQALHLKAELQTCDGVGRLLAAWSNHEVSDNDLSCLIPDLWVYHCDWPECMIGADRWVPMFRAAGFLRVPTNLTVPSGPLDLYRGASPDRSRGMAWSLSAAEAEQFRKRHGPGVTAVFHTTAQLTDMLAKFQRPGLAEEVVLDPERLSIERL